MFSHDDIWSAIDRLARTHGLSASGLARKAGLDPTSFNKSKRKSADGKPRWPSTESVSKVLSVTGTSASEFLSYIEKNDTMIGFDKLPSDGTHSESVTEGAQIILRTKGGLLATGTLEKKQDDQLSLKIPGIARSRQFDICNIDWMATIGGLKRP